MLFRRLIGCFLLIAGLATVTLTIAGLLTSFQLTSGHELTLSLEVLGGGALASLLGIAALVARR